MRAAAEEVDRRFGHLDVLVNNGWGPSPTRPTRRRPNYGMVVPAYRASKAALNNVTIALAKGLADTSIKVTSVCPGFVQTDLTPANRTRAPLAATEVAEVLHRAATLPDTAASGTFIDAAGVVLWWPHPRETGS